MSASHDAGLLGAIAGVGPFAEPRLPEVTTTHMRTRRFNASNNVILFLAADPSTTSRLALDEECAAIERELRMTTHRDDFEFRSKWAVTIDEMMRHLNEFQPTVIHFSGHGAGNQLASGRALTTTRDVVSSFHRQRCRWNLPAG